MSFSTPHRHEIDGHFLAAARRSASPLLRFRALAQLRRTIQPRHRSTESQAAEPGAATPWAGRLAQPNTRRQLAAAFEALLAEPRRLPHERGPAVGACREEIEVARSEIHRLATRLRDPRPVRPRGVALAQRLLTDRTGPLRAPASNDELYRQLRRATDALD